MGVDLCVEDAPQVLRADEVAASRPSLAASKEAVRTDAPKTAAPLPTPQPPAPLPSIAGAIEEARALADGAADLATLEAAVRGFNGCSLKKTATNTVFAQGVAASRLMFIGEAPGAEEDRSGVPFCGASGKLLDRMLSFIGLTRAENFYITNTLFWRPPGNRQPTAEELEICRPLVEKHIALVDPKILVLVGGTATKTILRSALGITRLRGQVFTYKNDYMASEVPVHVLYHPSYLLRQPLAKKQCWADLLALKDALHGQKTQ
ncbi:MAG: uracil-DNA glycosylase [Pseudomonadota bacterium]